MWATIYDLKAETTALKAVKGLHEKVLQELRQELHEMNQEVVKTKEELKEDRNKIVELEDYTRKENLKFNNIPESIEARLNLTPKEAVCDILQREVQLNTSQIQFQAVHWIESARGTRLANRHRIRLQTI